LGLPLFLPRGLIQIKTKNIFATIREISEILSLSNEPDKLADMALDTLVRVLEIDCCWIQTINNRKPKRLYLAAERGFSPEMRQEISAMDMGHGFSEQIIGLGHKIIIPDLANDGLYGLSSFPAKGYRWLVAVPLMTYRVHGILGAAGRHRKRLKKDTADLIMVIAGLIATALAKAHLFRLPPATGNPPGASRSPAKDGGDNAEKKPENTGAAGDTPPIKTDRQPDGAFHAHVRQMELFRQSHR
jgi:transcriptional regulator with GAF, ATPase, and Fis domain